MATDSTELTFIRCPSCRSLVPAVSTRCRMCGYSLEGSAEADEKKDEAKAKSTNQENLDNTSEEQEDDDPLSAFIEEVEMEEEEEVAAPVDSSDDLVDDFSEVEEVPSTNGKEKIDNFQKKEVQAKPQAQEVPPKSPPKAKPPVQQERPKQERSARQEKPRQERPARQEKPRQEKPPVRQEKQEAKGSFVKNEEIKENRKPNQAKKKKSNNRKPMNTERSTESRVAVQRKGSGNLYGWLVSYDQQSGSSIELREGKFFITGSSLKKTDLIVEDQSISTPHALITVTEDSGVIVQDLMSDQGVYVKNASKGDFVQYDDAVSVTNGDWIRFGEVEYLLALIPGNE